MRRVIALAIVLVVAGCSGFSGSDDRPDAGTDTETLSPVPVPATATSDGETGADGQSDRLLAPGLTRDGVGDPFALAGAHRNALSNQSYTVVATTTLVGADGGLRTVDRTMAVAAGGTPYHLVETSESDPSYPVTGIAGRLEIWFAGRPALFRVGTENVSYRKGTMARLAGPVGDTTGHDRLVGYYGSVDRWTVREHPDRIASTIVLESRESPDPAVLDVPLLVNDPRDATLRVVMTEEGRVVTTRVHYVASFDDERVEVVRSVRFVDVGNTTVAEPAWVDEARATTAGPDAEHGSKAPLPGGQ